MTITAVDNRGWLVPGALCAALYFLLGYPLVRLARRLERRRRNVGSAARSSSTETVPRLEAIAMSGRPSPSRSPTAIAGAVRRSRIGWARRSPRPSFRRTFNELICVELVLSISIQRDEVERAVAVDVGRRDRRVPSAAVTDQRRESAVS